MLSNLISRKHITRRFASRINTPVRRQQTVYFSKARKRRFYFPKKTENEEVSYLPKDISLSLDKKDAEVIATSLANTIYEKGRSYLDEIIKQSFKRRYEMAKKQLFIDIDNENTAFRAINQSVDNVPGISVDIYGKYAFIHVYTRHLETFLYDIIKSVQFNDVRKIEGVYIVDRTEKNESSKKQEHINPYEPLPIFDQIFNSKFKSLCVGGRKAPNHETIVEENGCKFQIILNEGPATGLYIDQRSNRKKLLDYLLSIKNDKTEFLNTFSYTCSFSVFPAMHDIKTVNIDVSSVALNRAKNNFKLNGIDIEKHEFIHDDVFTTLHRFNQERRQFDAILLDPPTVSHVRQKKTNKKFTFSTNDNYADLVALALPLVKPGGYLFAFVNTHSIDKEKWKQRINQSIEYVIQMKKKEREESNEMQIRKILRKKGVRKKIRMRLVKKMDFTIPEELVRDQYTFEEIEYLTQDIDFPYIEESSFGHYLHGLVFRRKISDVKIQTPPLPKITDDMIHPKKLEQMAKYEKLKGKRK